MKKNNNVGATSSRPHNQEIAKNNVGAGPVSARKERGITLIALIITIIVMLILVAVSISIALNTGLFDSAGKATQKTRSELKKETELANLPENPTVNDLITKYTSGEAKQPKIGDYVNYEPEIDTYEVTTDESGYSDVQNFTTQTGEDSLRWRIMSLGDKNGNILLVADRPTKDGLTLYNRAGYFNSTNLIEGFCSTLYDNQSLEVKARSYNYFNNSYSGIEYRSENKDSYINGGDRFPYLTNCEIWIPVSVKASHSMEGSWGYVASYNVEDEYSWNRIYHDYGTEMIVGTFPLLPVIIIPTNLDFVYSGVDTTDSNWNIWNLQENTDGMFTYADKEKTILTGVCKEHLVKDTEVIANNLQKGIKVASLAPIKIADYSGDYNKVVVDGVQITKLTIPEGVVKIENGALEGLLIKEVVLPSTLTTIEDYAFIGCKLLEKINIPNNVAKVGQYILSDSTGIATVTFKENEEPEGWNNGWSDNFKGTIQYAQ